ncbi:GPW/gp25 family protein [Chitinispirillales bacterium ANBcel5]|uniref:GPW/gp25 family protein n=1 Tax=Cellulosispirillum alkaliphilum TaxID=3039283 RepID=UPI002A4F4186|nr:GPW/gp25 family protein [Chitinispirillales bacterium ANBcel5]
MPASLFDNLTGEFGDGTPIRAISDKYRYIKSIESNLSRLFRLRKGAYPHNPAMGVQDGIEINTMLKSNRKGLEEELTKMILYFEPRISKVRYSNWQYRTESGTVICIIIATLVKTKGRVPFKAVFHHAVGGNSIEIATVANAGNMVGIEASTDEFPDD